MSQENTKNQQEKTSFEEARAMVDHVMLMWCIEHEFVGDKSKKKTALEWAEDFSKLLRSLAELGPQGQAKYVHELMEKISPGINFMARYEKLE